MKKSIISAMLLASITATAQETYQNAQILTEDLNGTARYVGMGGAMEALGADISTIGTNPAGIGLFRKSSISITGSIINQQGAGSNDYTNATRGSLDQIGFVWSNRFDSGNYLNLGFSHIKKRNYGNILNVAGQLGEGSQNTISYLNLYDAYEDYKGGEGWNAAQYVSQLDNLYYYNLVGEKYTDKDGQYDKFYYGWADRYELSRGTKGGMNEYNINVSGNVSNRVFLGLTVGLEDISYSSYTQYVESGVGNTKGTVTVTDERCIDGTGFNIKAGAIIFPVDESPFRIGLSISTPTWYELKTSSYTTLHADKPFTTPIKGNEVANDNPYDYKINSPWKFGVSLGHTISNYIALGASYEFADYSHISNRVIEGYDYYGEPVTYKDKNMNNHTGNTLCGVSTIKLGAEVKPTATTAVRLGYNYVSPMYKKNGFRDGGISSLGTYYSSLTDYTNWEATHRLTCGVGFNFKKVSLDFAYQYNTTQGQFKPFADTEYYVEDEQTKQPVLDTWSYSDKATVKAQRHQLMATLTYKF